MTHFQLFSAALKQDFAAITGGWNTATQLGMILCQSCVGLKLPEVEEYESFLTGVVDNVFTLAAKLLDLSVKERDVRFILVVRHVDVTIKAIHDSLYIFLVSVDSI